ncbi:MAG TPA: hypothetical protein VG994_18875, partial [Steroidobacteraceae bacterium]|nr:hypothetical protein [Steroidobacteraceae bacterium]
MGAGRVIKWTLIGVAAIVLLLGGLVVALFRTFYPSPPQADFPPPVDAATAQRQDFEYFAHYFDLNRTYSAAARARAQRMLAQYEARSGTFSSAQFELAIASMTALADNGHSRVHPGGLPRRHNRLPCRVYRFADGYYFIRARPACVELLGAKLLALDGHATDDVVNEMFRYFGGPRNHYEQFAAPFFLESPELLNAAGLATTADRLTLHVRGRDGAERDVEIVADPPSPDAPGVSGVEFLSPERFESEPEGWQALLPQDAALPVFLREFSVPFRAEYWPADGTYFAQFRSNEDADGYPIAKFVERIEREVREHAPRFVVLDLRFDQGGNFTTTASLMKRLPRLVDSIQHVYVLTSAWTFSAGNVSLALVRDRGGNKVTVIGEPVGDRVRTWAEGGTMQLPNSKLRIGFATGLHDYSRSCW